MGKPKKLITKPQAENGVSSSDLEDNPKFSDKIKKFTDSSIGIIILSIGVVAIVYLSVYWILSSSGIENYFVLHLLSYVFSLVVLLFFKSAIKEESSLADPVVILLTLVFLLLLSTHYLPGWKGLEKKSKTSQIEVVRSERLTLTGMQPDTLSHCFLVGEVYRVSVDSPVMFHNNGNSIKLKKENSPYMLRTKSQGYPVFIDCDMIPSTVIVDWNN